jgi:hypothetical protein
MEKKLQKLFVVPSLLALFSTFNSQFATALAQSQTLTPSWAWAEIVGTTNAADCENHALAVDAAGNLWVAGNFSGYLKLSNSSGFTAPQFPAPVLIEYNRAGIPEQAFNAQPPINFGSANHIAVSLSTNQQPVILANSQQAGGLFVIKYNTNGAELWQQTAQTNSVGGGSIGAVGMAVDAQDDIIVAGNLSGNCTIGANVLDGGDNGLPFIAKLSGTNGSVIWAVSIPFTVNPHTYSDSVGVAVDANGNIFVAGDFTTYRSTIPLYPSGSATLTNQLSGESISEMFLAKLDTDGHLLNITQNVADQSWNANVEDVAVDSRGHVDVAGTFDGNGGAGVKFGDENTLDPGTGGQETFLVQFTSQLVPDWSLGIYSGGAETRANSIQTDESGNMFLVGDYDTSVTLDLFPPDSEMIPEGELPNNHLDVNPGSEFGNYVAKYSEGGALQWVTQAASNIPGQFSADHCYAIAVDAANNVYAGGLGNETFAFGTNILTASSGDSGALNLFVAKLGTISPLLKFSFDPDPAFNLEWSDLADNFHLQSSTNFSTWSDVPNTPVNTNNRDIVSLPISGTATAAFFRLTK